MALPEPAAAPPTKAAPPNIGALLQYWRRARHLSQLALAHEADVSPRHVCFIETGRAKPSRDMVLLLAAALDVPLRERNALLLAAGFAPMYSEATLEAPELAPVRAALDAILRQQEPYPAVVMNRRWDILRSNDAATRFFGHLLEPVDAMPVDAIPANVLRLMFDPRGVRPWVSNWEQVAETLLQRVHRSTLGAGKDPMMTSLLAEILAHPGVPRRFARPDFGTPLLPVIPVRFRKHDRDWSFFSTVTVLGTPQDITLQEVHIECFFPADPSTERHARDLAEHPGAK